MTPPYKTVSESWVERMRASAKVKPSDFAPSSLCPLLTTSTHVCSPSLSASNNGSVPKMTSPPNCSRALRTHSSLSLSAALKLRTNGGSSDTLLSATPSSISNDLSSTTSSANGDVLLTSVSFSVELKNSNNECRGQWSITRWTYILNHKIPNFSISSLNNLSASYDLSMYFQGHIQERYSSVP